MLAELLLFCRCFANYSFYVMLPYTLQVSLCVLAVWMKSVFGTLPAEDQVVGWPCQSSDVCNSHNFNFVQSTTSYTLMDCVEEGLGSDEDFIAYCESSGNTVCYLSTINSGTPRSELGDNCHCFRVIKTV